MDTNDPARSPQTHSGGLIALVRTWHATADRHTASAREVLSLLQGTHDAVLARALLERLRNDYGDGPFGSIAAADLDELTLMDVVLSVVSGFPVPAVAVVITRRVLSGELPSIAAYWRVALPSDRPSLLHGCQEARLSETASSLLLEMTHLLARGTPSLAATVVPELLDALDHDGVASPDLAGVMFLIAAVRSLAASARAPDVEELGEILRAVIEPAPSACPAGLRAFVTAVARTADFADLVPLALASNHPKLIQTVLDAAPDEIAITTLRGSPLGH